MRQFLVGGGALAGLFFSVLAARGQNELPFTSEAAIRGIDYVPADQRMFGCGIACADLNNDGAPDLVLLGKNSVTTQRPYTVGVYQNDGTGHFTDRSRANGIPIGRAAAGVTAADYDGDGDLDLFITCWLQPGMLLRNDGNFQFTDVSASLGTSVEAAGQGSCWGDYDVDGWLDLYVANRTTTNYPTPPFPENRVPNLLYHNTQGSGFTETAVAMGVDAGLDPSFQPVFFDYDRDGYPDLYLSNDKGASRGCAVRNRLWHNVAGQFVDVSHASGTDGCIDAMCATVGDFDHNRLPDLYVSNIGGPLAPNYLYLNQGNGVFVDRAAQSGTDSLEIGWGSVFFDYNNDGLDDIYVAQSATPNRLYRNLDGVHTVDVAALLNVADPGPSYVCAVADVDNDGDMDILVSNRPNFEGDPANIRLFINHEGERRNWIKFRILGPGGNRFGVGAQIDVRTGATWQFREVIAGSNFKSQNDLVQHLGMNTATLADEVRVRWPGGAERTLRNYPVNRTWKVYPPSMLGDINLDGQMTTTDFFACLECMITAGANITTGCESFDMDGDGKLDSTDFFSFLIRFFQ